MLTSEQIQAVIDDHRDLVADLKRRGGFQRLQLVEVARHQDVVGPLPLRGLSGNVVRVELTSPYVLFDALNETARCVTEEEARLIERVLKPC